MSWLLGLKILLIINFVFIGPTATHAMMDVGERAGPSRWKKAEATNNGRVADWQYDTLFTAGSIWRTVLTMQNLMSAAIVFGVQFFDVPHLDRDGRGRRGVHRAAVGAV